MFCHKCGAQVGEGSRFCNKCGTPLAVIENDAATANDERRDDVNDTDGKRDTDSAPNATSHQSNHASSGPKIHFTADMTGVDGASPAVATCKPTVIDWVKNHVTVAVLLAVLIAGIAGVVVYQSVQLRADATASSQKNKSKASNNGKGNDSAADSSDDDSDSSDGTDSSSDSDPLVTQIASECNWAVNSTYASFANDGDYLRVALSTEDSGANVSLLLGCIASRAGISSNADSSQAQMSDGMRLMLQLIDNAAANPVYSAESAKSTIRRLNYQVIGGDLDARCVADVTHSMVFCHMKSASSGSSTRVSANSSGSSDDSATPGYEKYKNSQCVIGASQVAACSDVKAMMDSGELKPMPFGKENAPVNSNGFDYIPVYSN